MSSSDKIKINKVDGGSSKSQSDLKNCYFLPTANPGNYQFYDQNGNLILTNPGVLTSGTDFTFPLDSLDWTVTNFLISSTSNKGNASGNWSNNAQITADEGTFTAQAGGGVEETASKAYA